MVEWDERLSVGIASIDEQHQNLFRLINRLASIKDEAPSPGIAESIVDALLDYAQIHFQAEEEYFYRFNYADKDAHEREHGEFISRALAFRKQFEQQSSLEVGEVHTFLLDWLTTHIKGSDMQFKGLFSD